jgi:hypothetical protein
MRFVVNFVYGPIPTTLGRPSETESTAMHGEERFSMRFDDLTAFREEYESNWSKGKAFLCEFTDLDIDAPCQFVIGHPETSQSFPLRATVAWAAGATEAGVELSFEDFDEALQERLATFVGAAPPAFQHFHETVRNLSVVEQQRWARRGNLSERIQLERVYGSGVWEVLLQNPNLTPPEVARIAKKGQLPKPLVSVICQNPAWLTKPEVQRALLGNPRLGGIDLDRVLRALSVPDLTRVPVQTAYRPQVRQAAKLLLKQRR